MEKQNRHQPPRIAERFLEWFCDDSYLEDLQGDLYEYYHRRVESSGVFMASFVFFLDVLKNFKPYLFRKRSTFYHRANQMSMFRNDLKMITRNLRKHKMYAAINITGLALGITGAIFIWDFLRHETSFENFHQNRDNIYRITAEFMGEGYYVHWARTPQDWVNDLVAELPEVQHQIRFQNYYPRVIKVGNKSFKEEHAFSTDSNVFKVFSFPLIHGDPASALTEPFSVVLTEKLSMKYFQDRNPLGEIIQIVNQGDSSLENYRVTGVMADLPSNTHLPVNLLTSFRNVEDRVGWAYDYLHITPGTNLEQLKQKFPDLIAKYRDPDATGQSNLHLQAIKDIHLNSHLAREIIPNGDIFYVKIFAAVGLFLLMMAIINFTNLSTAKSLERTREVGIRKILGSNQSALFQYFMLEAVFYTLVATVSALAMVSLLSPYYREISGIELSIDPSLYLFILDLIAVTGFFSGIYPALKMSGFRPLLALKGVESANRAASHFSLKRGLVIIQFIISLVIISSTLITWEQFDFIKEKNLGFDTEQVLAITNSPQSAQDEYENFRQEVLKIPGIKDITANMEVPSREIRDTGTTTYPGLNEDQEVVMDIQVADSNYIDFMGMKLLSGRNFSPSIRGRDRPPQEASVEEIYSVVNNARREYVINETAVKMLGATSPEEVVGKTFSWANGSLNLQPGPIVGVVQDSHQETLHNRVDPLVLIHEPIFLRTFLIKLETDQVSQSLVGIEDVWKEMFPDFPLESAFVDDLYDQLYQSEQRQKRILSLFSYVVIFITLLGLLGLVSFMVQKRLKELAIRKILGASRSSILVLFGGGFMIQALVALIIAAPTSFYFMQEWLNSFAYRISITGWEFFLSFSTLMVLVGMIILIQVGRSANLNPAETLRCE